MTTLLEVGATHVIATQEEDFLARVKEITHDQGARVHLRPIAGKGLERCPGCGFSWNHLRIRRTGAEPTPFPLFLALSKGLSVLVTHSANCLLNQSCEQRHREYVFITSRPATSSRAFHRVFSFCGNRIKPQIATMESNEQIGKIVVTV